MRRLSPSRIGSHPLTDPLSPMETDSFPITHECTDCGFRLTVTEDDTNGVPGGLSARYQARIVLEDHGWSSADDPALCSSCNAPTP